MSIKHKSPYWIWATYICQIVFKEKYRIHYGRLEGNGAGVWGPINEQCQIFRKYIKGLETDE